MVVRVRDGTMTLGEFLESPLADAEPAWEYFPDGRIKRKVSPSFVHALLQATLAFLLNAYVRDTGTSARVVTEARAALPRSSPVPDLAVYRGRVGPGPDGTWPKYATQPPVLAIEILSPGQSRRRMVEKCQAMLREGTEQALVVDPRPREIDIITASGVETLRGSQRIVFEVRELAGMQLTVDEVFAELD